MKSPKNTRRSLASRIYIFQPASSRASMRDAIFNKLPPEQIFEDLSFDNLKGVIMLRNEEPEHNN